MTLWVVDTSPLIFLADLGVLLATHLRGEIPSVGKEIERLQALGFRATPSLVGAALREAGE